MCLLEVWLWKLLLLRMRMPKSENAFENKSQVTLQRWREKMEDEKGLVAREWLYTKVRWCKLSSRLKLWCWRGQHGSFCWYRVLTVHWTESFHADDGWMNESTNSFHDHWFKASLECTDLKAKWEIPNCCVDIYVVDACISRSSMRAKRNIAESYVA